MADSKEWLLKSDEDRNDALYSHDPTLRKGYFRKLSTAAWLLQLTVLIWLATVTTIKMLKNNSANDGSSSWSPGYEALEYETRLAWQRGFNPLVHGPDEEVHAAWDVMEIGKNIKVTADELLRSDNSLQHSVETGDGTFVGILGVYHSIHCLNELQRLIRNQGHETATPLTGHDLKHSYHCISFLLDAVTCKPDLTLYRSEWIRDYHERDNKAVQSNSMVQCAKWDRIHNWASDRALARRQYYVKADPLPLNETHNLGGDDY